MIRCAQCGSDNPPGHFNCVKCRAKFDSGRINRDFFPETHERNLFRGKIRLILAFFILISLAMAFCPQHIEQIKASDAENVLVLRKVTMLQQGIAVEPIEFSEKEVSLLFNNIIQESRRIAAASGKNAAIYAARVTIRPGSMTIQASTQIGPYSFGSLTFGPYWLTYKASGAPRQTSEGLRFAASGGSIGYFPFLGGYLTVQRLKMTFRPFKNARNFLGALEIVDMKKGSIKVSLKQ